MDNRVQVKYELLALSEICAALDTVAYNFTTAYLHDENREEHITREEYNLVKEVERFAREKKYELEEIYKKEELR